MTQTHYQRYDFAAAARVKRPLRKRLNRWSQKTVELFIEQWAEVSATPVTVSPINVDAKKFVDVQKAWENPCCGVPIGFQEESVLGMFVIDNDQLQVLLMDILGGSESGTKDRQLTSVEISLAKVVYESVALSYSLGWFGQEPLQYELGEFDCLPNRSRLFPPDKELLMSGLRIQLGESAVDIRLVLAKDDARELLGVEQPTNEAVPQVGQRVCQERITEIQVKLNAELGIAKVDMKDLVSIAEGDIVVLEQPVYEPISISANGQHLFRGWPGKQQNKQVVKIDSILQ